MEKEQLKLFQKLKDSDYYKNYIFDKEELEKVKIDISFIEYSGIQNDTKLAVGYVISEIEVFQEIKPLIHVLKRYLHNFNLNTSFNGNF